MPHIRVKSLNLPSVPFFHDGVEFKWVADSLENRGAALVGVKVSDVDFALEVKPKGDTVLFKAEKISRPSPNTLLKKALQAYIDITKPDLLFENISNIEQAKLKKPLPSLKEIATFDPETLPDKPLWIEIGFGSGRHLLHQAKINPDVHMIGLEIHKPSLEQVMRRIDLEKLDNIWVIDYDARLFMELLPSNRVSRIFVHFPVPWDKKPHRRVISPTFLDEAMRVLKPGGTLELRTDSENYFSYSMEVFSTPKRVQLEMQKNEEAVIRSKYEDRWQRQEKDIYEIHLKSLEYSKEIGTDIDFSLPAPSDIMDLFAKKPKSAWIKDGYFVHLEKFFAIDDNDGIIRLSMGSFDRPEHKYILIKGKKALYYPYAPVKTKTNQKAHRMICEWIGSCKK